MKSSTLNAPRLLLSALVAGGLVLGGAALNAHAQTAGQAVGAAEPAAHPAPDKDGIGAMREEDQELVREGVDSSDRALEESRAAQDDGGLMLQQEASQMLAGDLIGLDLRDQAGDEGQSIGRISDLILNANDQLAGVVVGVGGFLGVGEKDVALPLSRIERIDMDDGAAYADVSKQELEDAPDFRSVDEQGKEEKQGVPES